MAGTGNTIELPWPHKLLWPNGGRGNRHAVAGEVKKHKQWAWGAALADLAPLQNDGARIPVLLVFHPKPRGPAPDKDNAQTSAKAYLDGIAKAMGVDDRLFDPHTEISPVRGGKVVIRVGDGARP